MYTVLINALVVFHSPSVIAEEIKFLIEVSDVSVEVVRTTAKGLSQAWKKWFDISNRQEVHSVWLSVQNNNTLL